jgi:hypothetical protein
MGVGLAKEKCMRTLITLTVAVLAAAAATGAQAAAFTCPATIESDTTSGGMPQSFKFRYVSFFDGDPLELADLAPEELPNPDKLMQRWEFVRTKGRPIVMICRYHGTQQTVRKEVPANIKECRLEGVIDAKGEIQGSPTLTCN